QQCGDHWISSEIAAGRDVLEPSGHLERQRQWGWGAIWMRVAAPRRRGHYFVNRCFSMITATVSGPSVNAWRNSPSTPSSAPSPAAAVSLSALWLCLLRSGG